MGVPVFELGPPVAKWEVALLSSQQRFSALSPADPVVVAVKAFQDGAPINPTAGTGQMAFMDSALAQPAAGDWKSASWDTNDIGEYVLECLIGSAGVIQLASGSWYVWAQITLSPADLIRQVGSIVVE